MSVQTSDDLLIRSRIRQPGVLGVLTLSHIVNDFYQGAVPAILPFLVLNAGYSYGQATGIMMAATVVSSVAQPAFGVLADRHELRWLVPISLFVAGLGIGLAGLSDSYWMTWAAVALSGLGVAAYHPAAARAARAAAGTSAQGMSWFAVGGNIGLALGPVVATPILLVYGLGGTPILAIPAVLLAAAMLGLARCLRNRMSRRVAAPRPSESVALADDDWRSFGWLTALAINRSVLYFGVSSLLALYTMDRFGSSPAVGAAMLTLFLSIGVFATVTGGWIADRRGRTTAIRLGFALNLPGLGLLLLAPNVGVAAAATVVIGVGTYLPFSVQTTLGHEYLPNRIGTASGVTIGLAVSAGGALAPVLGAVADAYGLRTAIATLVILPPLGLLTSLRLRDRVLH